MRESFALAEPLSRTSRVNDVFAPILDYTIEKMGLSYRIQIASHFYSKLIAVVFVYIDSIAALCQCICAMISFLLSICNKT